MLQPKISIVVPTWNGEQTIRACLVSLLAQTLKPFEVIAVDNGSTDDTAKIVSKTSHVKLIKLPENTGVVGGRNRGLAEISKSSDYVLFFDHDMVANKRMLQHLLDTSFKFSAGIVTPKIYYKDHPKLIWAAGTDINLWTGQVLFRNGPDIGQYAVEAPVAVAPAAMLIRRDVTTTIGGFNSAFVSSWEDTEYCFRARKAGFKVYYSPQAIAYHDLMPDPRADTDRLFDRYAYYIGQNRVLFMKEFGCNFSVFVLFFLPVYLLYYLCQALRFGKTNGYIKFLQGTRRGLTTFTRASPQHFLI